MKTIPELKELRVISHKAFMFNREGQSIRLTKEEQNILAEGKQILKNLDRDKLLSSLGISEVMTVSKEVKNCCIKAIYCGSESAKIDNNYKVKRPDTNDIIESILENNKNYLQLLDKIRHKIITVENTVNYNSKI